MNVLIAKTAEECARWKETTILIDVLNGVTTVCTLLSKGERKLVICADENTTATFKSAYPDFTLMSQFPITSKYENDASSTAEAISQTAPVLLAHKELGYALSSSRLAEAVLLGGFCNFRAVAQAVRFLNRDVLLVPVSLFNGQEDDEDLICAQAFKDFLENNSAPEKFTGEFLTTRRYVEYRQGGSKTAEEDLKLALALNGFSTVPQAAYPKEGNWTVCVPFGKQPDATLAQYKKLQRATDSVQEPQFKTMVSLTLHPMKEKTLPADSLIPQPDHPPKKSPLVSFTPQASKTPDHIVLSSGDDSAPLTEGGTIFQVIKPHANLMPREEKENILEDIAIRKPEIPQENLMGESMAEQKRPMPAHSTSIQKPAPKMRKKAIVLFSGGLDSTTCLHWAIAKGYECEALTVSYGQRHSRELESAQIIARKLHIKHYLIDLQLPWLMSSSLVDTAKPIPDIAVEKIPQSGIPSTYVPGRNLMFLSIAGSLLDSIGADAIVAGPNAIDFSGYPDCTPAFFKAAAEALNRGTKRGVRDGISVLAPLMNLSKADIVRLAVRLHVPLELTWSCYAGGNKPCGKCDSCKLRAKGFEIAGIKDPAL